MIDALYISSMQKLEGSFDSELRNLHLLFPYTDIPFAKYYAHEQVFYVERIKAISYDAIGTDKSQCLGVDSGVTLFIHADIFTIFAHNFSYDDLFSDPSQIYNENYWQLITDAYHRSYVACILSSGIGSGVDFDGSGTYKIT